MSAKHLLTVVAAAFALNACGGSSAQAVVPVGGMAGLGPDNGYYPLTAPGAARPVCPKTADARALRCFAWMRTDLHPSLALIAPGSRGIPAGIGFTASNIQRAYHLDVSKGSGQTVYIIDAFGYKRAANDLAVYRAAAGLPACTGSCFRILNQKGKTKPLPSTQDLGWDGEQSLDLDAVSAACPKCNIVLIQTDDSYSLANGRDTALRLGAKIVSMSFGGPEFAGNPGLPMSGVALVASAGDDGGGILSGGGPEMPCTYAAVICVGGTALTHKNDIWSEVVWNDEAVAECGYSGVSPCGATSSACSAVVSKPSWQGATGCKRRAAADVSAVASPLTPFAIYNKAACGGWCGFGGTSLSAPLIAGIFGLAGNASSRHAAMELWKTHNKLNDVVSGTNVYRPVTGKCASPVKLICVAGVGYDGPTGWGTPNTASNF